MQICQIIVFVLTTQEMDKLKFKFSWTLLITVIGGGEQNHLFSAHILYPLSSAAQMNVSCWFASSRNFQNPNSVSVLLENSIKLWSWLT